MHKAHATVGVHAVSRVRPVAMMRRDPLPFARLQPSDRMGESQGCSQASRLPRSSGDAPHARCHRCSCDVHQTRGSAALGTSCVCHVGRGGLLRDLRAVDRAAAQDSTLHSKRVSFYSPIVLLSLWAYAHGIPSKSRPAGTLKASARITTVGKRGARFARSIFEIAVVCRPVARDRSSWDHPRSARSALRLAAKCWSGLTAGSFRVLAQEAKRHIVNLQVEFA
jgi:hypothetical protein